MATLSIPVTNEMETFINNMIKDGKAANKADVVRKALQFFAEEQLLETILKAEREPSLSGDLRELMKKLK